MEPALFTIKASVLSPKREAFERRQAIIQGYVKKFGIANARQFTKEIAEKYKVSERRIRKDFEWIKGNFKPGDLIQAKIDIKLLRDKTLETAFLNINTASTAAERNEAIKSAWVVIEKYRQDMEEWGEKQKIAEKHEILSKNISLEIIRHDGTNEDKGEDGIEFEAGRSMENTAGQSSH